VRGCQAVVIVLSLTTSRGPDACNCYLSWDKENLGPASVFEAATAHGPSGALGTFDEDDVASLQEFLDQKNSHDASRSTQQPSSSQLYQALGRGEIRVLELHPGEHRAPLEGSIHVVSVDFKYPQRPTKWRTTYTRSTNHAVSLATGKPMWYTALSYVWGVPVFDEAIRFAHKTVTISSSLAVALYRLRSTKHSIFLWIDQICINQLDIAEKEQQIPLMGLIYAHATNTVIWLGDEDGQDPNLAFDTMEYVYARLQMSEVQITPDDFQRLDFPPADHQSWRAVRQLLQRPWLFRLWTVQEAVLSKQLYVKCGDGVASWDDIAAWCYVWQLCGLLRWLEIYDMRDRCSTDVSDNKGRLPPGGAIIQSIQSDRLHNLTLGQKQPLLSHLVQTRYAQATNVKDKIYGLLGMAESAIAPDYSPTRTARDVYHEACVSQIPELIYELLSCVDHDTPLAPSWVPDWSTDRVTEVLGYYTKAWTLYQAGGRVGAKNGNNLFMRKTSKVDLSEDKQRVTLSGVMFDTVVALGNVNEEATLDIDDPPTRNRSWASNLQLIKDTYDQERYPASNISIYDAFWHTLIAGRDGSGTSAPSQEHSDVFSLILDSTTGEMPTLPGQTYSARRQKGHFTINNLRTRKPAKTLEDLRTAIRSALTMRRFAITQKGYFALVPRGTRKGDVVVVFEKACVPFVVRNSLSKEGGARGYELLGEAYVHGIMRGEVMEMADSVLEDITLV
jgi:hypothetical protein